MSSDDDGGRRRAEERPEGGKRGNSSGGSSRTDRSGLRKYPNIKDAANAYLRREISEGRLRPGEKIDQDHVADTLGISRLPVREALIELAQKGYVNVIPRRGAFVVDLTVEDLEDHFEVIGMVMALATRRAVKKLTAAQMHELRSIDEEIKATDDPATIDALNRQFHGIINDMGSSASLSAILEFLTGTLPYLFYIASPNYAVTEAKYRARTLEALEARDADAAGAIILEHLRESAKLTVEVLRERGYWTNRPTSN